MRRRTSEWIKHELFCEASKFYIFAKYALKKIENMKVLPNLTNNKNKLNKIILWNTGFVLTSFTSDKHFLFTVTLFTLATSMATRENLKKTNISVLRNIASDLGINSKKKKKDDLICDILSSQAPEVSLTPVVQSISAADGAGAGAVVQFKENMPPFNAVHYEPISHNTQLPKVSFTSVYEFMITRRRQGDQSIQNFKGLDKSVKHFDAGDVQDICLAQVSLYFHTSKTISQAPKLP